ncbi:hypothetical protein CANINC_004593 [Pichia inconspicua]|uniref:RRM domain-containing protein n=1 Tax=Pichia inconspicua TaxID=52247 RepID=A0A4T0WVP6_9ASCO|nr:hypothetical protein CANINC_004593 [[Candida] inconspicua]
MSTVTASNIPATTPEAKISEFFSFCGKIKQLKIVDKNDKTQTIEVEFEKPSAISTAVLLNGAEFDGLQIEVTEPEGASHVNDKEDVSELKDGDDIDQESKPKSAVIAELLASGYVLQSSLVDKAVKFDQEKGISERFKNWIENLDKKYHIQEKNKQLADQTSSLYDQANSSLGLESYWNNSVRTVNSYLDKFKNDKYGSQVHDFYKNVTKDAKAVNDEALRLAELKKKQQEVQEGATAKAEHKDGNVSATVMPNISQTPQASAQFPIISSITPESTSAAAAAFVPLSEDKK